jgi:hypothetical protein
MTLAVTVVKQRNTNEALVSTACGCEQPGFAPQSCHEYEPVRTTRTAQESATSPIRE